MSFLTKPNKPAAKPSFQSYLPINGEAGPPLTRQPTSDGEVPDLTPVWLITAPGRYRTARCFYAIRPAPRIFYESNILWTYGCSAVGRTPYSGKDLCRRVSVLLLIAPPALAARHPRFLFILWTTKRERSQYQLCSPITDAVISDTHLTRNGCCRAEVVFITFIQKCDQPAWLVDGRSALAESVKVDTV